MNYFVFIRRNYHCFTGNVKSDVANANQIINNIVNNYSTHYAIIVLSVNVYCCSLKLWLK